VKTSPYYPQSNGKIERWHQTLKGDCIRVKTPLSLDDARRIMADYVEHYNNVRLHGAIAYVTPKDKLAGRDQDIFDQRDRKLAEARERRKEQRRARHDRPQATGEPARPALDFAAIRAVVSIAAVLQLLGGAMGHRQGTQHRGPCPLHGSTSGTSRCFSANLKADTFHCFKCSRSGNALDLWAQATSQNSYDAAVDLCQRLPIPLPLLEPAAVPRNREEEPVAPQAEPCTIT
jgi:hypothetical protein